MKEEEGFHLLKPLFLWERGPFWYNAKLMNLPETHSVFHDSDILNGAEFCLFRVWSIYVKAMGHS